jgi:hypothetical protein
MLRFFADYLLKCRLKAISLQRYSVHLKLCNYDSIRSFSKTIQRKSKELSRIGDTGRQLVIKRGRKQAYILKPVTDDDFAVTPELSARMEKSRQQAQEGK